MTFDGLKRMEWQLQELVKDSFGLEKHKSNNGQIMAQSAANKRTLMFLSKSEEFFDTHCICSYFLFCLYRVSVHLLKCIESELYNEHPSNSKRTKVTLWVTQPLRTMIDFCRTNAFSMFKGQQREVKYQN